MDKIWYRNPSKSEVFGLCGGDEKTERPRRTDKCRTLKNVIGKSNIMSTWAYIIVLHIQVKQFRTVYYIHIQIIEISTNMETNSDTLILKKVNISLRIDFCLMSHVCYCSKHYSSTFKSLVYSELKWQCCFNFKKQISNNT